MTRGWPASFCQLPRRSLGEDLTCGPRLAPESPVMGPALQMWEQFQADPALLAGALLRAGEGHGMNHFMVTSPQRVCPPHQLPPFSVLLSLNSRPGLCDAPITCRVNPPSPSPSSLPSPCPQPGWNLAGSSVPQPGRAGGVSGVGSAAWPASLSPLVREGFTLRSNGFCCGALEIPRAIFTSRGAARGTGLRL